MLALFMVMMLTLVLSFARMGLLSFRRTVFFQEHIRSQPQQALQQLCQFLGIDATHQPAFLNQRANASYLLRYSWLEAALKKSGKWARSLQLGRLVDGVRNRPLMQKMRAHNRLDARQKVPPMLEETRQSLRKYFAEDQEALCQLLELSNPPYLQGTAHHL